MIITMVIFTNELIVATSIILTLLAITIYILISKLKEINKRQKKSNKTITKDISIAFYLGTSNLIVLTLTLLMNNYL